MKASLGKIKLTPPDIIGGPIGRPMAGYSPIPKITKVQDDIYCHGILIETVELGNIKKRMLLLSMDFLYIPLIFGEYVKEKVEDAFNIHPNQILIHGTHTHKSIDMAGVFSYGGTFLGGTFGIAKGLIRGSYNPWNDKYKVWVAKQVVKLAENLISKLQPAKIAWKKNVFEERIARNRNSGKQSEQPFGVICFKNSETNKLFGIVTQYSAHPTIYGHKNTGLSAEFPGQVTKILEEKYNNEIEAIFFNGPAGDVSPSKYALKKKGSDDDYWKKIRQKLVKKKKKARIDFTNVIHRAVESFGREIAEKMDEIVRSIADEDYFDKINFKSYVKTFWVPVDDFKKYRSKNYIKNRFIHIMKRHVVLKFPLLLADVNEPNFPGFALKHKGKEVNIYSQLQLIKLSFGTSTNSTKNTEMIIVGIPGELFEKYGYDIYNTLPTGIDNTFIIQNANDWVSYLFPLRDYVYGDGIEAFESLTPLAGSYVMNSFYRLWRDIELDIIAGYY